MEFLLQLMAELFNVETEQPELIAVAETLNNETVQTDFLHSFQFEPFETESEITGEENLIFNFINFN